MIKLVKTIAGSNGSPQECQKCGSKDFRVHVLGWACMTCLNYHPSELGFDTIKSRIVQAHKFQRYNDINKKEN